MRKCFYYLPLLFAMCVLLSVNSGCGIYSFTGVSTPAGSKTATVKFFTNQASQVNPTLSQRFTDKLLARVENDTPLKIIPDGGDIEFSGAITNYTVANTASGGNDQAKLNRLTVTIRVDYRDNIGNIENTKSFSQFADFDQGVNLSTVETALTDEIITLLVNDIFNATLGDW